MPVPRRPRKFRSPSYLCPSCGEKIVIDADVSAGASQEFTEDCPVCCRPNVIHVEVDEEGGVDVRAAPEQ